MALGKHYVGNGATAGGIHGGHARFVQEIANLGQMQMQAALLNYHYEGPQKGLIATGCSAAMSTISDPLGLGWGYDTVCDISQGTSYGLNSRGSHSSPSAYIGYGGTPYVNGFEVTKPSHIAGFNKANESIQAILAGGQPAIEKELSRLNCAMRDIELVAQAYASKGYNTDLGGFKGNNNAPKFDPTNAMYGSGPAAPNAVGVGPSFNI